jgi:hypothetical protein
MIETVLYMIRTDAVDERAERQRSAKLASGGGLSRATLAKLSFDMPTSDTLLASSSHAIAAADLHAAATAADSTHEKNE